MPKATLHFDLPEEHFEFYDALHGWQWRSVVEMVLDEIRTKRKHSNLSETATAAYESLADLVYAEINDLGLSTEH